MYFSYKNIYGKSGMKENELLLGRPYGGVAILVERSLVCRVNPVTISDNNRIFACTLEMNEGPSLLLINVYMPCGDSSERAQNEFFECVI